MGKKVLISSSDASDIKKLTGLLSARKIEAILESQGSDTMYDLLRHDLFFVLIDFSCNSSDAFDIVNIIKRIKPNVPVVSISDFSSVDLIKKIYAMNVSYHAAKPVQTGEIDRIIDALENFRDR